MNIISLFPTAVSTTSIDRDLTEIEISTIQNLEQRSNQGNRASKNTNVLNLENLSEIKKFIESNIRLYFDEIVCSNKSIEPFITQSWVNFTKEGEYHHKHSHSNSILSGTFYINADVTRDKIYFFKDTYQIIDIVPDKFNQYNSSSWWVPVKTGDLVLFPSRIQHQVDTVSGYEERISIAFNVFIKGTLGTDIDLNLLSL
jgi:uncharacterized protein (TIGR02466 family)